MVPFRSVFIILCIAALCIAPVSSVKSKGLFSGEIIEALHQEYMSDVPDTPMYLENQGAIIVNPQNAEEWIIIGKNQLKAENWKEAENAFEKAVNFNSSNEEAWEGFLVSIMEQNNWNKLIDESKNAIEKMPDNFIGYLYSGGGLHEIGKYQESLKMIDKSLKYNVNDAISLNIKAGSLSYLENYQESQIYCLKSLEFNPNDVMALNILGYDLFYLGKYEEGLRVCEKSIKLDPENYVTWAIKGSILNYLGRYTESVESCETSFKLEPKNSINLNNLGFALVNLKRYEEGLDAFYRSIDIDPNYSDAWNNIRYTLEKLGRQDEAREASNKACNLDRNYCMN